MSLDPAFGGNAGQIEFWNGPIGETWASEVARTDRAFAPYTRALLAAAAVRAGEAVLDLGCGGGETTLAAARAAGPGGRALGVDISRPMLALAARRDAAARAEGPMAPITWLEADASTAALPSGADLLVSRFGSMFFDDPPTAFRHLRGALAPGGRLALMCWAEPRLNVWASGPVAAVAARYGKLEAPPADAPGPFAFADPERVRGILESAGFEAFAADPVAAPQRIGVAAAGRSALEDAVDYLLRIGPVRRYLREKPEVREGATETVREFLAPFGAGDVVELPAACWIYTARA